MKGFFNIQQTKSNSHSKGKVYSCPACGLYKTCKSPRMQPFGNFKKGILNIGEAPGETEDRRGKQWQGKTGQLLQRTYKQLGIDLFEDCLNINACNCRPIENNANRTPTNFEIDCCRKMVLKTIEEHQPKLIMVLGGSALYSILGHRWGGDLRGITKWRGFTIPDKEHKAWICPVFHPSYVDRSEKEVGTIWKKDLEQAFKKLNEQLPRYKKPSIKVIEDLAVLNYIKTDMVAIDFETTGLKPHAVNHRIVCASIVYDLNHCYVFMIPKTRKQLQPFLYILNEFTIGKIAHNMKFEDTWAKVRLNTNVHYWLWDTILAAHVLDNRPGITNLKFQTYVNFGVPDYKDETAPYLKAIESKNANSINRINELLQKPDGKQQLLERCAMDSIWTFRLAMKQMDIMNYSFLPF